MHFNEVRRAERVTGLLVVEPDKVKRVWKAHVIELMARADLMGYWGRHEGGVA